MWISKSLRINFFLVGIVVLTLAGCGHALVCEQYDVNKCLESGDMSHKACRPISEHCTEPDYGCFAFWDETPEGDAIVSFKGCNHQDNECDIYPNCTSLRPKTPDHSFCCCTEDNCNTRVLKVDGLARPKGFVEKLKHEVPVVKKPTTPSVQSVEPGRPTLFTGPSTTAVVTEPGPVKPTGQTLTSSSMDTTLQVVVGVAVFVCVVLFSGVAFAIYRYFRRRMRHGKNAPYDLEGAHVMAPLMSKEYENQDGCVLLKNLILQEKKATGRYGEVWKGRLNEVTVAVKVTPASEVESWKNEVHIYHKFLMLKSHPNILRFIMSGHRPSEGKMFLLTEYHQLGSLVDLLKGRSITNEEAEIIMCSMLAGLAFLHDTDAKPAIAHRDLKSTNVLIKDDMTACIADFGLATPFEADERIGDKHNQVGTRRYMAPELLEGAISLNVVSFLRVDVYACGMILWEVMSRTQLTPDLVVGAFRLPLEAELGHTPTNETVQLEVVQRRIRPALKDTWKTNPRNRSLCTTIEECWDADPEGRPSASCLLNRLRLLSTTGVITADADQPAGSVRQG